MSEGDGAAPTGRCTRSPAIALSWSSVRVNEVDRQASSGVREQLPGSISRGSPLPSTTVGTAKTDSTSPSTSSSSLSTRVGPAASDRVSVGSIW